MHKRFDPQIPIDNMQDEALRFIDEINARQDEAIQQIDELNKQIENLIELCVATTKSDGSDPDDGPQSTDFVSPQSNEERQADTEQQKAA